MCTSYVCTCICLFEYVCMCTYSECIFVYLLAVLVEREFPRVFCKVSVAARDGFTNTEWNMVFSSG